MPANSIFYARLVTSVGFRWDQYSFHE